MRALAPGWCEGPLRRLGVAPPLSGAPALPEDTGVGLLERIFLADQGPPDAPPTPFVALWEAALDARALLSLHRAGCVGVALAPGGAAERHAVSAARALGLPLVALEAADTIPAPGARWRLVAAPARAGWASADAERARAGVRRVFPLTALGAARAPWLELLDAQREELWLARAALGEGRAVGVGLLRLEYLCYADPGLDAEGLYDRLAEIVAALPGWPVTVRLTDWGPRKPPPPGAPLGQGLQPMGRGLGRLWGSGALELQVEVLGAVARLPGARLRALAPHAEAPWQVEALRSRLGVPLGAMVEGRAALSRWEALAAASDGIWLGLGDLGEEEVKLDSDALEGLWEAAAGGALEVFVCGVSA